MIKLEGGFELDEYWSEVRQTGDERLDESDFVDWVVIVRPRAAGAAEGSSAREEESAVKIRAATKTLEIAVDRQPDLPPEVFVQISIIDVIAQAIEARGQDHSKDWVRDEGGEA